MVEAELLFCSPKKDLKLGMREKGDGDDVAAPGFAHVDGEVALGNVRLLPQRGGASLQKLLQWRHLSKLAVFPRHLLRFSLFPSSSQR